MKQPQEESKSLAGEGALGKATVWRRKSRMTGAVDMPHSVILTPGLATFHGLSFSQGQRLTGTCRACGVVAPAPG